MVQSNPSDDPTTEDAFPTWQTIHPVLDEFVYEPTAHGIHSAEPEVAYVATTQSVQSDMSAEPTTEEALAAGQARHSLLNEFMYQPAAQVKHSVEPEVEDLPIPHARQFVALEEAAVVEYLPAPHSVHAVAPFVEENDPGKQARQLVGLEEPVVIE